MWARVIEILVGLWVMSAPGILGILSERACNNNYIVGPIIVTFATVALNEATRPCRWVVFVAGIWLMVAPFVLGHWVSEPTAAWSDIVAGGLATIFPLFRGKITGSYDGGWTMLWKGSRSSMSGEAGKSQP